MTDSSDTEITLSTGKLLAVFFGLAALCALFFGMGYSLGKSSVKPAMGDALSASPAVNGAARPSAVKPSNTASSPSSGDAPKSAAQKDTTQAASSDNTAATPGSEVVSSSSVPPDPTAALPLNGYYVQVAAVSKQEDADALVEALKLKQYPAFAANQPSDKLFHVRVGPFADIKEAEAMRTRLASDGYNPILKK